MSLKIMVVGDNPEILDSIKNVLESMGSLVLVFADSRAATELNVQSFDAMFVDAQIPHLDAFELTRSVRSSPTNRTIPVIMLTDQDDSKTMRRAFKAGATYFLSKPVTSDHVRTLYNALLGPMLMQRRQKARVPFQAPVNCSAGPKGETQFVVRSLNLSQTGMLLECSSDLELGQLLNLQFSLPSIDQPLRMTGRVMRAAPPNRFGVRFIELPLSAKQAIQAFIVPIPVPNTLRSSAAESTGKTYQDLIQAAVSRHTKPTEANSGSESVVNPISPRRTLIKPIAYAACSLVAAYLMYRVASSASASLGASRVENLACAVQAEPPRLDSSDASDSPFVTLSPAVVQVESNPGQSVSYALTLTNHSKQQLNFHLTAADLAGEYGRLGTVPWSQSHTGPAVGVEFSPPTVDVKPGQTLSVNVTLTKPRDSAGRSILILLNGTDEISASKDRFVHLSPASATTFANPASSEKETIPRSGPRVSMARYSVCQWRSN